MSDILIRGVEMPHNFFQCPLSVLKGERLFCEVTKDEVLRAKLAPDCPLLELPPHGDLIERDAVLEPFSPDPYWLNKMHLSKEAFDKKCYTTKGCREIIEAVPVVVQAERREE